MIDASLYNALHWALRPVLAIRRAYRYVLSGEKVHRLYAWKEI